jgi:hypothetical protein
MKRIRDAVKIPMSRENMARRSRRIKSVVNCDITLEMKHVKIRRYSIVVKANRISFVFN